MRQKLKAEIEGQWTEIYGYVVYVTEVSSYGKGKVQEETGHAMFVVRFTAQVTKTNWGIVLSS
jgi:DNA-directed RNA polymerase subunit E'/Rpb7